MLPRLIASLAACAVLASAPALADRDRHGRGHGHGHGGDRYYREVHRTVVYEPVYVAPRRVYVPRGRYYHEPRYVEHHHHHGCGHDDDAWKWIGGSILVGAVLADIYD